MAQSSLRKIREEIAETLDCAFVGMGWKSNERKTFPLDNYCEGLYLEITQDIDKKTGIRNSFICEVKSKNDDLVTIQNVCPTTIITSDSPAVRILAEGIAQRIDKDGTLFHPRYVVTMTMCGTHKSRPYMPKDPFMAKRLVEYVGEGEEEFGRPMCDFEREARRTFRLDCGNLCTPMTVGDPRLFFHICSIPSPYPPRLNEVVIDFVTSITYVIEAKNEKDAKDKAQRLLNREYLGKIEIDGLLNVIARPLAENQSKT